MPSPIRIPLLGVLLLAALSPASSALGENQALTPNAATPCGIVATPPAITHFVVVWGENTSRSEITTASAPFLRGIADKCTEMTQMLATDRPSQPNYVAMTSGSPLKDNGTEFDNCVVGSSSTCHTTRPSIFGQVTDASYQESMGATNCRLTDAYPYAVKHNPQTVYTGGTERTQCNADNQQLGAATGGALDNRIKAGTLPQFTWIEPNMVNSAHDGPITGFDNFAETWVTKLLNGPNYAAGNTAVIVSFDEPAGSEEPPTAPIYFTCIHPGAIVGKNASTVFNHYSVLKAIEQELGVPLLGNAAAANTIRSACNLQ